MKNYLKISALFLSLFAANFNQAQQTFGIPVYSNCYQRVEGGLNGGINTFRFLNTNSGRTITMSSTNPLDISEFEVYGRLYGESGFNHWITENGELIIPTIYESIQIVPVNNTGGSGGAGVNYSTTQINFVDFDFDILSNNGTPPCLTFNNLNINLTHNLDGLCQNPTITMKMPPGAIQTYGLGSNFSLHLNENQNYQIPIVGFCGIYNGSEMICLNANRIRISCCFTFDFEITLYPCIGRDEEICPPITFTKQFPVCCFCGEYSTPD